MAKKPRDYDAELQALMDKAKKLKGTSKNSLPRRDRNEIHSDGKQS
jgi:hypothetical protein